jgi:hypothetical protein
MKNILAILTALALGLIAQAARAEITIKPPSDRIAIGKPVKIDIGGTTPETLRNVKLDMWPSESVLCIPAASWGGEPFLLFVGEAAGDYTLSLTYQESGKVAVTQCVIGVGPKKGKWIWWPDDEPKPGPGPGPQPPDPPKPPEPNPGGKKQVAFVIESSNLDSLPLSQRSLLASLTLRQKLKEQGHQFLWILDKDVRDPTGNVPAAFAPFLGAAAGKPLPQLCFAPLGGGEVTSVAVPATEAELFKILDGGQAKGRVSQ